MDMLCYGDELEVFDLYALISQTGKCLHKGRQQHTHLPTPTSTKAELIEQ
jgi:hypothetical protein